MTAEGKPNHVPVFIPQKPALKTPNQTWIHPLQLGYEGIEMLQGQIVFLSSTAVSIPNVFHARTNVSKLNINFSRIMSKTMEVGS